MIFAIPILDPGPCAHMIDETLSLRAKVFRDVLNWDVHVDEKGHERDEFDELPGTYLVSVDSGFKVQASLRLLPTTGPYMASDVFSQLLGRTKPPRSATIWESSRFFARPSDPGTKTRASRYWATQMHNEHIAKLMCGLACYAREIGVSHIVSVFDVAVERFLKSMGVDCDRFGEPQKVGNTRAVAGMFSSSILQGSAVVEKWGFDLDTLVKHPRDLPFLAQPDLAIPLAEAV